MFAENIRDGFKIDPVEVQIHPEYDDKYRILDGAHRWHAYKEIGATEISVLIITLDGVDPILYAAKQDIRLAAPDGPFHIVLCRNLAFTYFDMSPQKKVLGRIFDSLLNEGILVIGIHELLPGGITYFRPWISNMGIYRKAFV
jgi:hypothetical protein